MSDRPQSNSKLLTPDSSLISQKPTCYQPVITASCDPTAEEVTETSSEDLHITDRRRSGHHRQEPLQRSFVVGLEKKQRSKKGLKYAEKQ